jgi:hypothetical protein
VPFSTKGSEIRYELCKVNSLKRIWLIYLLRLPIERHKRGVVMKYIIFVIDGPNNPASPNEMVQIDTFNEELRKNGSFIMAAGISGPQGASLIDNREGLMQLKVGSLSDSTDYYSGFWIIEVGNESDAKKLALEGSRACNRRVELRRFL